MAKCDECKERDLMERCEGCGKNFMPDKKPWKFDPKDMLNNPSDLRANMNNCLHENCSGCKNGTCNGVHMMSCPCRNCSPIM